MAKSDPEVIIACDITNPNPRAPPVTTVILPSSENCFSVRLNRMPRIVGECGRSLSSGCLICTLSSVVEYDSRRARVNVGCTVWGIMSVIFFLLFSLPFGLSSIN